MITKNRKTYDTSKVVYKNCKTPVIFICHEKDEYGNEHGNLNVLQILCLQKVFVLNVKGNIDV